MLWCCYQCYTPLDEGKLLCYGDITSAILHLMRVSIVNKLTV